MNHLKIFEEFEDYDYSDETWDQMPGPDIYIGVQKVGTFDGTCGMGMYPFDIKFE